MVTYLKPFGEIFKVTPDGSSHGLEIKTLIEGCPQNLPISLYDIQCELDRRKPDQSPVTSRRKEEDKVKIKSGIKDGKTTGGPIKLRILNKDRDLSGYKELERKPRPGHADYPWYIKTGDWYAFDSVSGRMTACIVMAGAIAKKLLERYKIDIFGHSIEIAGIRSKISYYNGLDLSKIEKYKKTIESNPVRCLDVEAAEKMVNAILEAKKDGDSVGGIVEVIATGVPVGLGEPNLKVSLYSGFAYIPAEAGIAIGLSDRVRMRGSQSNDPYCIKNGKVKTVTNYCGGILGRISNGMPIVASVGIKPTSSISKPQKTVDLITKEEITIEIKGRHDPCIVPRAVPVVESMTALVLADQMLLAGNIPRKLP